MAHPAALEESAAEQRVLARAPEELVSQKLAYLGEGIGKVVYASPNWVVKRERRPREILALIAIWRTIRKLEGYLPGRWGRRLLERPAKQIRLLRILAEAVVLAVPVSVWMTSHIGGVRRLYKRRDRFGELLAESRLQGSGLIAETVTFPPVRVRVKGWPGWLVVEEATERVEQTLDERINDLARERRFDEIEVWLERFLELRQAGWRRGVFSLDAHLKNFGVRGDRIVLIDPGGLTNRWEEIADRLDFEGEIQRPHAQLGLENTLRDRPDISGRFDEKWKLLVNPQGVRGHWPEAAA
jgi:hypothetical protein